MNKNAIVFLLIMLLLSCFFGLTVSLTDAQEPAEKFIQPSPHSEKITNADWQQFDSARKENNYKDAYALFEKLAFAKDADAEKTRQKLSLAIGCLHNLNRYKEIDSLLEKLYAKYPTNVNVIHTLANNWRNLNHSGYIVEGNFERGSHRGGGKYVNTFDRDRVIAIRLFSSAMTILEKDPEKSGLRDADISQFYIDFYQTLLPSGGENEYWQLQHLTDLKELPDFEESMPYYYRPRSGNFSGSAVDINGDPVFYHLPESFSSAKSDGQRVRWLLHMAEKYSKNNAGKIKWANFLRSQFGVQTLAQSGIKLNLSDPEEVGTGAAKPADSLLSLYTLKDDETVCRLATGVRRFTLPDEFNFFKIYQEIASADVPRSWVKNSAQQTLSSIYENRLQFDRAAKNWQQLLDAKDYTNKTHAKNALAKIIDPWARFDSTEVQPAGRGATVGFVFRNANTVKFTARAVDLDKLIQDQIDFINRKPQRIDIPLLYNPGLAHILFNEKNRKYIGDTVAEWNLALTPSEKHFDRRIQVTTPLQKAGAYVLEGRLENGQVSRILLYIADTAIVEKKLNGQSLYFISDAVTGAPLSGAEVEFFAFNQKWLRESKSYLIKTKHFAEKADSQGLVKLTPILMNNGNRLLAIARTKDGHCGFLGFNNLWFRKSGPHTYRPQATIYSITDRPVYRPGHTVKFHSWAGFADYASPVEVNDDGKSKTSYYADVPFDVTVRNPKGDVVLEKTLKADRYGGFGLEYMLPEDATLGVYNICIRNNSYRDLRHVGSSYTFRVEEYRKPEFEVKVKSPELPVRLGEKITATIEAKYYFGSPVSEGKVKYRVLRYEHSESWLPPCPWDWLYGEGYGWFYPDYVWYPGWRIWGKARPAPWWMGWRPTPRPEVVQERTVDLTEDGTAKIMIDTVLAKEIHGDTDHRYEITAEVTDASRRTIIGSGSVIAARKSFSVYTWLDKGYYKVGDTINVSAKAITPDRKGVTAPATFALYRITYDKDGKPSEAEVAKQELQLSVDGTGNVKFSASQAGQYRVSCVAVKKNDDNEEKTPPEKIEGGTMFVIRGVGFDGHEFHFNSLEIIADQTSYKPGDVARVMINTDRADSTVMLFINPENGIYPEPKMLHIPGKSVTVEIPIEKKNMPNFFVEALTVSDAKVHIETCSLAVPPEKRVLTVEAVPDKEKYLPGEKATVKLHMTDAQGNPAQGALVMSVYDRSLDYIAGSAGTSDIRKAFWGWTRRHNPQQQHNLHLYSANYLFDKEPAMQPIGIFGSQLADLSALESEELNMAGRGGMVLSKSRAKGIGRGDGLERAENTLMMKSRVAADMAAPLASRPSSAALPISEMKDESADESGGGGAEVHVRSNFADTAFWKRDIVTDENGTATISFTMPENLSSWKIRTWGMSTGTRVGFVEHEVVTARNVIVRAQAPRFFVEKDEVVLSANIHNYFDTDEPVTAILEIDGDCLVPLDAKKASQEFTVPAGGEVRADWRMKVVKSGSAVVRMKAVGKRESDAMEITVPVREWGAEKQLPFSGVIRPQESKSEFTFTVPEEIRPETLRLELRYSPTLAGAMLDAIPYLAEYPYGCTEQTLNKFIPAVIARNTIKKMGLDLSDLKDRKTNLNAQEIGEPADRAAQWKKHEYTHDVNENSVKMNPVFDEKLIDKMVKKGLADLNNMQLSDGGWGWFSGYGERSSAHTTATVVHGLLLAKNYGLAVVPSTLDRGLGWLVRHEKEQIKLLSNAEEKVKEKPSKRYADNTDALVYSIRAEAGSESKEMRRYLMRDREHLSVYSLCLLAQGLERMNHKEDFARVMKNISQYLHRDAENQTAWLDVSGSYWWFWYGSEIESMAAYLKLLAMTDPKNEDMPGLVKYLLNNRKHATYWNSTRDTAYCLEAFAEYISTTGEDKPNLKLDILLDGSKLKSVEITPENLFSFDGTLVLNAATLKPGKHTITINKAGESPLYYNSYVTFFTKEDKITPAGLEIKLNRKFYRLVREESKTLSRGARGQASNEERLKYTREPLADLSQLKSGELLEVELTVESKNDYEYIILEDLKPSGFEPDDVRSGYNGNELGAYVEFRDERVCFFVTRLARGKHSVSYRLRAETPGNFGARPARAEAMYAPELRANSESLRLLTND